MKDLAQRKLDLINLENLKYKSPTLPNSSLGAPARLIFHTSHFQRLGRIKTLGVCSTTVDHNLIQNRLSHSVGVGLIAKELLKNLVEKLPQEISIEEKYFDIVEIAGLCHDLGHGPFSHCFEQSLEEMNIEFVHENQSLAIFEHMLNEYDFRRIFKQKFNFFDKDFELLKHLITGDSQSYFTNVEDSCMIKENFLFQIVANKENNNDVDRWEYLTRDTYFASKELIFDFKNLLNSARVFIIDGKSHVAYDEKKLEDIMNMFRQREENFTNIYGQANSILGQELLIDILKCANGKTKIVENWLSSIENFLATDDSVLKDLEQLANDDSCNELGKLLQRFNTSQGYPLLALWEVSENFDFKAFERQIKNSLKDINIFARDKNFIKLFNEDKHFDKIKLFDAEKSFCFNFDIEKYTNSLPYTNAKRIILVSCKDEISGEEKLAIGRKLDKELDRFSI